VLELQTDKVMKECVKGKKKKKKNMGKDRVREIMETRESNKNREEERV
jgi:hypothetical protein